MQFMNAVGYDAMCLGNHEFDYGQDVTLQRVSEAHFPMLACNIVVKATNPVGAKVGQHVKVEVRDVNIVIGAFVCFVMPLLIAAAGAFAGYFYGTSSGIDYTHYAIGGGIVGFLIGAVCVKLFDRSLTHDINAKPKVVEIMSHEAA